MPRWVAFLRGLNVGGHRLKMDELRRLFRGMGLDGVSTFIASGNVVFDAPSRSADRLARSVEKHLNRALGYDVPTFVRTIPEVARLAEAEPFPEADVEEAHAVHVIFLDSRPTEALRSAIEALESERDRFAFAGREVFWLTRGPMSESPVFRGGLVKACGDMPHTTRNVKTLRRLAAKLAGGPDAR